MGKTFAFVTGLLFGALAGYVAGILSAPRSGEETRQDLNERAIVLRERAEETAGRVRQEILIARQHATEDAEAAEEAVAPDVADAGAGVTA